MVVAAEGDVGPDAVRRAQVCACAGGVVDELQPFRWPPRWVRRLEIGDHAAVSAQYGAAANSESSEAGGADDSAPVYVPDVEATDEAVWRVGCRHRESPRPAHPDVGGARRTEPQRRTHATVHGPSPHDLRGRGRPARLVAGDDPAVCKREVGGKEAVRALVHAAGLDRLALVAGGAPDVRSAVAGRCHDSLAVGGERELEDVGGVPGEADKEVA